MCLFPFCKRLLNKTTSKLNHRHKSSIKELPLSPSPATVSSPHESIDITDHETCTGIPPTELNTLGDQNYAATHSHKASSQSGCLKALQKINQAARPINDLPKARLKMSSSLPNFPIPDDDSSYLPSLRRHRRNAVSLHSFSSQDPTAPFHNGSMTECLLTKQYTQDDFAPFTEVTANSDELHERNEHIQAMQEHTLSTSAHCNIPPTFPRQSQVSQSCANLAAADQDDGSSKVRSSDPRKSYPDSGQISLLPVKPQILNVSPLPLSPKMSVLIPTRPLFNSRLPSSEFMYLADFELIILEALVTNPPRNEYLRAIIQA